MKRSTNNAWVRPAEPEAPPLRTCDQPGCTHAGEYRAPRSRADLTSYFWFCLEHVRAYNAAWDFYAGMSVDEIEAMLRQDVTWQRPTWPLGARMGRRPFRFAPEHLGDPFGLFHGDEAEAAPKRRPPTAEEKAMRVLDLQAPLTVVELKARYKELVKRHHPDANGGAKAAEERFKEINQAYKTLLNSLNA